jgi:hypothetical protein
MNQLRIVPFEIAHLEIIKARKFEARELARLPDLEGRVLGYMARGMAYTGFLGEEILMCGGIVLLWPGVGEGWSITTPLVTAHPVLFHFAMRRIMELLVRTMGLWRLEVAIQGDHYVSQRWIKRLGFEFEGFKQAYGPDGSDYVGFARVRKPQRS